MMSLIIWLHLWSSFFVLALPALNIHHSQSRGNLTLLSSSNLLNHNAEKLTIRQKTKLTRNKTISKYHQFDISTYRSSWTFIDKTTIRVRYRLYESLLLSVLSARFLVRHARTNEILTYDEPSETANHTITLYLQNLKHGRHSVCLLLYTSKLAKEPRHIFCQDIIFNFKKYGHHDSDSDETGNTFVFLLTQYAIVLAMLCILQLIYAARKRRFLRTVYDKANSLRNYMMESHHRLTENKSETELNHQPTSLEYLIYNLSRNTLDNIDEIYMKPSYDTNTNRINDSATLDPRNLRKRTHFNVPDENDQYLKVPSFESTRTSVPSKAITEESSDFDEDVFDENEFDTSSYDERKISLQSLSHILEVNKPWITKLTNNGNIEHSVINSQPV